MIADTRRAIVKSCGPILFIARSPLLAAARRAPDHYRSPRRVPGALSCTEGRKNAGYPVEQRQAKKSG